MTQVTSNLGGVTSPSSSSYLQVPCSSKHESWLPGPKSKYTHSLFKLVFNDVSHCLFTFEVQDLVFKRCGCRTPSLKQLPWLGPLQGSTTRRHLGRTLMALTLLSWGSSPESMDPLRSHPSILYKYNTYVCIYICMHIVGAFLGIMVFWLLSTKSFAIWIPTPFLDVCSRKLLHPGNESKGTLAASSTFSQQTALVAKQNAKRVKQQFPSNRKTWHPQSDHIPSIWTESFSNRMLGFQEKVNTPMQPVVSRSHAWLNFNKPVYLGYGPSLVGVPGDFYVVPC